MINTITNRNVFHFVCRVGDVDLSTFKKYPVNDPLGLDIAGGSILEVITKAGDVVGGYVAEADKVDKYMYDEENSRWILQSN